MVLFICSTPFQIFNAVNISRSCFKKDECDIYILDYIDECVKIYSNLKDSNLFRNIYLIKIRDRYFINAEKKIQQYLNLFKKLYNAFSHKEIKKFIPNSTTNYDQIFIGGPDLPSQLIYYYFSKKNTNIILNLFEEGVYTYYVFGMKPSLGRKFVSKMLFGMFYLDKCKNVYVYKPELVDKKMLNVNIITIPSINKEDIHLVNYLNKIMGVNLEEVKLFDKKFIFLDSAFQYETENSFQRKLINNVQQVLGKKELGIKLHPRTNYNLYGNNAYLIKANSSLELIALNRSFNNSIIISIISSASLNFKLIFNEEPYVIMLYKMFKVKNQRPYIYSFVEKFEKTYSNDRFFIPENENELIEIIKMLNNI